MKKFFPVMVIAGLMSAGVLYGVTQANAQSANKGYDSIVEKIASKFNLNKDDVKAVFDEEKNARKAEMEKKFEERLSASVTKGAITEVQKKAILAKAKELRDSHTDMMNLSKEERLTKMKEQKEALKKWADEQGLTEEQLKGLLPFGPIKIIRHQMRNGNAEKDVLFFHKEVKQ